MSFTDPNGTEKTPKLPERKEGGNAGPSGSSTPPRESHVGNLVETAANVAVDAPEYLQVGEAAAEGIVKLGEKTLGPAAGGALKVAGSVLGGASFFYTAYELLSMPGKAYQAAYRALDARGRDAGYAAHTLGMSKKEAYYDNRQEAYGQGDFERYQARAHDRAILEGYEAAAYQANQAPTEYKEIKTVIIQQLEQPGPHSRLFVPDARGQISEQNVLLGTAVVFRANYAY